MKIFLSKARGKKSAISTCRLFLGISPLMAFLPLIITPQFTSVIRTLRRSAHASRSPSLHVLRGEAVDQAVLQGMLSL